MPVQFVIAACSKDDAATLVIWNDGADLVVMRDSRGAQPAQRIGDARFPCIVALLYGKVAEVGLRAQRARKRLDRGRRGATKALPPWTNPRKAARRFLELFPDSPRLHVL